MSLTRNAARKIQAAHADRKDRQCPAAPGGKQCTRTVARGAGAESTCGRQACGFAMLGL